MSVVWLSEEEFGGMEERMREKRKGKEKTGEGIPLLRSISRVSTVLGKRWSPDQRTPNLKMFRTCCLIYIWTAMGGRVLDQGSH